MTVRTVWTRLRVWGATAGFSLLVVSLLPVGSSPAAATASPQLTAPHAVDFGSVTYPQAGSGFDLDVDLTNTGCCVLTIGAVAISGANAADFTLLTPTATMNIGSGTTRTLTIEFLPTGIGPRTANLTMHSNDPAWANVVIVLTGNGVVPPVDPPPGPIPGPPPPTGSRYMSVSPTRIVDTRIGLGIAHRLGAHQATTLALPAPVPSTATAVVLNVTATNTAGPGYVTLWPSGSPPLASNVSIERAGQTIANLVTVPVGPSGTVQVFSYADADLVVDLAGWFEHDGSVAAGRFRAITPTRALDTRTSAKVGPNASIDLQLAGHFGLPASGMAAVALNVTATETGGPGFLTVWPTDRARPQASSVNFDRPGATIANQVIVALSAGGSMSVYSFASSDVIVDVVGWFTDASAPVGSSGLYWPTGPTRVLDTRNSSRPAAGATVNVPLVAAGVPPSAIATLTNVTATQPAGPGFVTAWSGVGAPPGSSNLNIERADQTIANHVITPTAGQAFALYTYSSSQLIVDVSGWFQG